MIISKISPNYNTSSKVQNQSLAFTSSASLAHAADKSKFTKPAVDNVVKPINVAYGKFTDCIARGLGKVLDQDFSVNLIKWTKKHKSFDKNLISHLIVLASTLLSGFYIKKTLENDKLEPNKRRTLAINQGITWGISTIMAYTFDGLATKTINAFTNKFKDLNKGAEKLQKYENGIKIAKSTIIMSVVYRFIAPVVVTPIANKIGNSLNEKK